MPGVRPRVTNYVPHRETGVTIMLDANATNSRQKNVALNTIERWRDNEVIMLMMADASWQEAFGGNDTRRHSKAATHIAGDSGRITRQQHDLYSAIEHVLWGTAAGADSERNDTKIVYEAGAWGYILVTNDGASKRQPRGILGSRADLAAFGITVMRPEEAVAHTRLTIQERDARTKSVCAALGIPVPAWVDHD